MTRRRHLVGPLCVCLSLGAIALGVAHLSVSQRVDEAVAEAATPQGELSLDLLPQRRPSSRERVWTDTQNASDGGGFGGALIVATSGGLVDATGTSAPLIRTSLTERGLADHDLTALAVQGGGETLALGSRSGIVTLIKGSRVQSVRIDGNQRGAVVDVAWVDHALFVATTSGALIRLEEDLSSARLIGTVIEGGGTALALGTLGLVVAGGDGAVYRLDGDELIQIAAISDEQHARLTSLALSGERLIVGSPVALLEATGDGRFELVRQDLFVTALLSIGHLLYVGTFDQGVVVLDLERLSGAPVRRVLQGRQISRLRLVDGRPMAFGPGLVVSLDGELGEVRELELPRGIASNHVTALAFDDRRRLWVGHFDDGVDVLDRAGAIEQHLPSPELEHLSSINAMAFDQATGTMFVATSRGVLEVNDEGVDVLDQRDGLIGDSVTALLIDEEERTFATSRGLTVASRRGAEMRSIYAFHGLPSNRAYALARALGGGALRTTKLIVGTLGGVAALDGIRVTKTIGATSTGLQANWCSALSAASEGIYIGTVGGGVDLWRADGVVERLTSPRGERFTVNPGAMLIVGEHLLVGTTLGLLLLERTHKEWRSFELPIPDVSVTALASDEEWLYLGTNRGLMRFGREGL